MTYQPSDNPTFTHLLAAEMWERSQVPKPTALGTPLRYSSSFACARQQGYYAFDIEPTEPMDEAGAWVTGIGTIIHEAAQEAILKAYPAAEFEVASGTNYISGSCDALIPLGQATPEGATHILWELKTMGTYSFDKQVGWNRMRGEWKYPEGPALKAIAQAGMNALGIEATREGVRIEDVVMGSVTFEALSITKADKMDVKDYNRFLAEFWIPRDTWEPLAISELKRAEGIFKDVEQGLLPDRVARDDEGAQITLNPSGRAWQCDYCSFKTICDADGDGVVSITQSVGLTRDNA
jgi:hypothetical protein